MNLDSPAPLFLALVVTGAVAAAAYAARSLTRGGAIAAFAVGASALARAWGWGAFLIAWFVLASVLSRVGRTRKLQRTDGIIAKGDRRDAMQVLANGGVFGVLALASSIGDISTLGGPLRAESMSAGAAAALVAAGADTWGTEIGTLRGGQPWSIRSWTPVPVGTSGAISLAGTVASAIGALLLALIAAAFDVIPPGAALLVAACGFAGAAADTLVGAWWQERRWCNGCGMETEQAVHRCGAATVRRGGVGVLTNDVVNFLCTLVGAALTLLLPSPIR
ncbi:MAG TPA: DUF92 domain-containing protein [Gemmatimonas sp.]|nr:DUF92 domain-containing protein [Gemmatimonas sp.]